MTSPEEPPKSDPVIAELPLWQVFLFGLGGSAIFGIVLAIFIPMLVTGILGMSDTAAEITGWTIFLAFYLLIMAALWKNAYNTDKPILGHLARAYAVLTLLLFAAIPIGIIVDTM